MKLLFFDDFRLGVLKADAVIDVSQAVQDIPRIGPHDLISGLIERFADYRRRVEDAVERGRGVPAGQVRIRPLLPKPGTHRVHGGELHGGRDACRAGTPQCLPQVPRRRHRRRRHHGAAGPPRHHLRGRGRGGAGHRQAGGRGQCGRGDGPYLRVRELHRRIGPRAAAQRQHVLSDEVARHLRPHGPVSGHRR